MKAKHWLGLLAWHAVTALAASDAPTCPAPITFALYENGSIYETKSDTGIDKDVALELAKRSGCRFEFSVKPRARIWHELEEGRLMMTGSGIQSEQRDQFAWSVRYMVQKNYVLVAKSLEAKSADQFAADPRLLWGAVRAYKHGEHADAFLDKLRGSSRVMEEADVEAVFRRFATAHRIAAILATPPAYAKYIKELNLADQLHVEDWFAEDPPIQHALFFSRKHFSAAEIDKWHAIVKQMRADGTLKNIFKKYLGEVDAQRMLQYKED